MPIIVKFFLCTITVLICWGSAQAQTQSVHDQHALSRVALWIMGVRSEAIGSFSVGDHISYNWETGDRLPDRDSQGIEWAIRLPRCVATTSCRSMNYDKWEGNRISNYLCEITEGFDDPGCCECSPPDFDESASNLARAEKATYRAIRRCSRIERRVNSILGSAGVVRSCEDIEFSDVELQSPY